MIWVRSAIFNAAFFAWTAIVVVVAVPILALPQPIMIAYARGWSWCILTMLRLICGLDYRVVGREKIPEGGAIIACKHQSTWETIVFFAVCDAPVYILKRELLAVPFFGWCLIKSGMIPIDRKGGSAAMRKVIVRATDALTRGRKIVIFPQGTRVAPGVKASYQPGAVGLYTHLGTSIVPAALDSGRFWARRSFLKHPGTITLEFLEPIPPGLRRAQAQRLIEERVEAASDRLLAGGRGASPRAG
ncbi:MAG: 1-acyl-sn-glycerol-3-phosphate acyltransferase [Alphaproteobacteria bacterium]|nr:1-acyl-sn-glycerol-3-phosphate acyltransferase [Alphaproteobacteria bacterium]